MDGARVVERLLEAAGAAFVARTVAVTLSSTEHLEAADPLEALPLLSIIVPARNEERGIEDCVRSLLAQRYPDFEIIVVNDESKDRTGAILERVALQDPRLRVIHGQPLPEGWVGKPWALAQGTRHARGEWLLFTDADTTHEPRACASAMRYALAKDAKFLSLLTTQRFETAAERLLVPSILWMIAFGIGSLEAINDPRRADVAILNGQYLLCDRRALQALGGHERVRSSIAEDYDLACLIKRDGRFRMMLVDANDLVYTRMYRSFGEIWDGFSKNLYVGVRDYPVHGAPVVLALAAISPLPEIALAWALWKRRYGIASRLAATILATSAAAELAMRRSRFPPGSGALLPVGAAGMLAIFINSAFLHRVGRVYWRGRRYSGSRQTPRSLWNPPRGKR